MLTELGKNMLKQTLLFNKIVEYCHNEYTNKQCIYCDHKNHCPGSPTGNCKQCLKEVHYPQGNPDGRKDYDCDKMIDFYVCDYTAKYASEMLYLMRQSEALKKINNYHVLSIGCGACPDLMALEKYCQDIPYDKKICYYGIDVNERWKPIHNEISSYRTSTIVNTTFKYFDAVINNYPIKDANVLVLQYVISHFYNTGQISSIHTFFGKLIDTIVMHRQTDIPMVILINDVNSYNRGRDYFDDLIKKLKDADLYCNCAKFYFEYNIQNDAQRYGEKHESRQLLFDIPKSFYGIYQPWKDCSSAQLLIEVF